MEKVKANTVRSYSRSKAKPIKISPRLLVIAIELGASEGLAEISFGRLAKIAKKSKAWASQKGGKKEELYKNLFQYCSVKLEQHMYEGMKEGTIENKLKYIWERRINWSFKNKEMFSVLNQFYQTQVLSNPQDKFGNIDFDILDFKTLIKPAIDNYSLRKLPKRYIENLFIVLNNAAIQSIQFKNDYQINNNRKEIESLGFNYFFSLIDNTDKYSLKEEFKKEFSRIFQNVVPSVLQNDLINEIARLKEHNKSLVDKLLKCNEKLNNIK